jgi:CRP/FNR family transcriptional regulator, polysaccharide utilization system transcription regulator
MSNKILIIDDSIDVRENADELLSLAGFATVTAVNGKEGLDLAKKNKPDLILCDIMMPVLDGYGVLRAIENIPELTGTPFIFMTAKAEKSDFRAGMDLGADDYLTKPFTGNELLGMVNARLKKIATLKSSYERNINGLNDFIKDAGAFHNVKFLAEQRIIKKLKKKDILFMEGDSPNYLYFVVSGKVKTYKTNESGKEYITEIHGQGNFFGYIALFEDTMHQETAMAIDDAEIALIPKQDFFHLLYSNREISVEFIKFMSNSLAEAENKLLNLAYNSARKRVAEAILFVSRKFKDDGNSSAEFPLNRENISALAGISPESVSRNLTDFKDEGLIETHNGNIKILNQSKLENLRN